jgi:spore coat polysaccharide biosynthesis protein SpsF
MLTFRFAGEEDVDLVFKWANEKTARENSYNPDAIAYEDHVRWFNKKIHSADGSFYIFINEQKAPVGQVRIEKTEHDKESIVSILIDESHRGKGYSIEMLQQASDDFLNRNNQYHILAYVFKRNEISYRSFIRAGYVQLEVRDVKGVPSYILKKVR